MPFFDFGKTAGELVLVFEVPDLDLKYLFPESYLEMSAAQLSAPFKEISSILECVGIFKN